MTIDSSLGVDVQLDPAGDIQLSGRGELVWTYGTAKVEQNAPFRLLTRKNQYYGDGNFGSDVPVQQGRRLSPQEQALLESDIRNSLLADPYIQSVISVNFANNSEGTHIEVEYKDISNAVIRKQVT